MRPVPPRAGAASVPSLPYFLLQIMRTMLFHVPAHDPWTVCAVLALLAGVVMLASWIPSRRAALVNPVEALRQE